MSEPIITFNNRTLRVEGDGWNLEAKVLASGKQIAVRCDGNDDLVIHPNHASQVFVSSHASAKQPEEQEPEAKGEKRGRRTN